MTDLCKEYFREKAYEAFKGCQWLKSGRCTAIRMEVELGSPLQWLRGQCLRPAFYWKSRDATEEVAVIGEIRPFEDPHNDKMCIFSIQKFLDQNEEPLRFYGGMPFQTPSKQLWGDWKHPRFFLPRFEYLVRPHALPQLTCYLFLRPRASLEKCMEALERQFSQMTFLPVESTKEERQLVDVVENPSKELWRAQFPLLQEAFEKKEVDKVVLARQTTMSFEDSVDPWVVLQEIQDQDVGGTSFAFSPTEASTFLGIAPERLYRREGSRIFTEAVAGTCSADCDPADLLNDPKQVREHLYVKEDIERKMKALCIESQWASLSVIKRGAIQHLRQKMTGTLKPLITDRTLLSTLHPTPAVAGTPLPDAMEWISKLEIFDRGWYAGPIGWISKEESEFVVAIRSAFAVSNQLYVYAGVGLIAASEPEKEWEELNMKIQAFMNLHTMELV